MPARPKDIGTRAETAVTRLALANGFPKAHRRELRGRLDPGDIELCDGVIAESKVRDRTISAQEIAGWMLETQRETKNARADYGFLVVRKHRANVKLWPTFWFVADILSLHYDNAAYLKPRTAITSMHLIDTLVMLRHCGYGTVPKN
jgi:hypothetical protein